jgi:hypothetical protein
MQKPSTSCIQKADNSLHIQTRRHFALHSNASIPHNAQCSQSVPPITISTLVSYVTYLSLIIVKIIPHPMTLLIAFPLQVIIPYLILYCLFSLTYCHITDLLSSSHIPSPCICPTHHLNPSHSMKDVPPLFIKNKKFFPTRITLYKHLP